MSSPSPDEPSTPSEGLNDDELSKRFYFGGMLGLPWLWIVHAIHFYGKQRSMDAQRMLREAQRNAGKDDAPRYNNSRALACEDLCSIPFQVAS